MRSDLDIKEYIKELEEECNNLQWLNFVHKCVSGAFAIILGVVVYVNYL